MLIIRHLVEKREHLTGKREQEERIDNFWMIIDLIFNFHAYVYYINYFKP